MDFAAIIETIVKTHGAAGLIIVVLLIVIKTLFSKYETAMNTAITTAEKTANALAENTRSLDALREMIKDRKP